MYCSPINIFLSHAWDIDSLGNATHFRAQMLNSGLKQLGWKVWFDEEMLIPGCNIDSEMARGIEQSDVICLCITRRYIDKINSQRHDDNCVKEFNLTFVSGKRILPLILEREMLDPRFWPSGVAQMYLINTFYIDFTGNMKYAIKRLSQVLHMVGLTPLDRRINHYYFRRRNRKIVPLFRI